MKIIKPLTLGVLNRPYRYRGQHRLAIAALGFFKLGAAAGDRLLTENLQWAKIVPGLPTGLPLDHILPKAYAEVLLSGSAHAPGKPVKAMKVRMQCGSIDKSLCIVGDRKWKRHIGPWLCVDEAKPFSSMPITWENAFGGAGYAANPLGRGYLPRLSWVLTHEGSMPNVEPADGAPMPGRRGHAPAGFSPALLQHAVARVRSGSYDQRWLDEDFPGLPRDFDFALFNLAPTDQQFAGRFKGDEAYVLEGLHATQPRLSGSLPGFTARAFVLREGQAADATEEVALACDTVWFFPDLDLGVLVYRGEVSVSDSDALDISTLMVAYERMGDTPRSLAHYRQVMTLRLDSATAGLHAFNESQLAPERSAAVLAARLQARQDAAAKALVAQQARLDEHMADFWQKSGMQPPAGYEAPQATPPTLQGLTPEELTEGEFDLAELHAQALALADKARRDGDAKLAESHGELATRKDALPVAPVGAVAPEPVLLDKVLKRAAEIAWDLAPAADEVDPVPQELQALLDKAAAIDAAKVDAKLKASIRSALADIPPLKRAARRAALTPTTLESPLPEDVAAALGRQVMQWLKEGVCLAGRDLAGADLRGCDLRGVDLREAMLEYADLRGACLAYARLQKVVLTAARLDGADFGNATLDDANLCGTVAVGTNFRGASLQAARAVAADWRSADLCGTRCTDFIATDICLEDVRADDSVWVNAVICNAKASGSRWQGAQWSRVVATATDLAKADFSGAKMERCVLMDASLAESVWQGASLGSVYGGGKADWSRADMRNLRASRSGFHGARMCAADMRGAVMAQCDFGEADLSDATLQDSRMYRSLFMRTRLRRVSAKRADFFQALCRKADFSRSDFSAAILVQADDAEACWDGADRSGARVSKRAKL